ncbi:HAMP domain-containing sensor histidine kinase [Kitasatospora paranensis]|uniref:histidine kinase n=1 Tax=Kitasatospora paranensis TaxID=258053 RepID=A0ABW2FUP7_9ACTN
MTTVKKRAARSPARRSLSLLRRRLTAAYTGIVAVGLAALSLLVLRTDARSWQAAEYDEMGRRAAVVTSLIYYERGRIQLDGLQDDEATTGSPQVTVLLGPAGGAEAPFRPAFASRHQRFPMSAAHLHTVAATAMAQDRTVTREGTDDTGRPVHLLAAPFYEDGTQRVAGAVVVVGDPLRGSAEHRRLAATLALACAAFTLLGAAAGHALSGRSLRPAWQALDQQERLLADAAHELRTPVAVMRGAVDLAEIAPGALAEHLPRLRRASDRMADVIENLLARGRLRAGVDVLRREPVRLDQLVEAVCAELPPEACLLTLDTAATVVAVDPGLARLAVRNLLDNALRHGTSAAGPHAGTAEVAVTVRGAEVVVADRGPGLDPREIPLVLTRFHSPGGGTGIGLSLVDRVAVAHGGSIRIAARPGGGAVFTLRLARDARRGRWRRPGTRAVRPSDGR